MAKRWGAILATVALVFGLAGCVRITSDITLHEDNTVSGQIVIAVKAGSGADEGISDEQLVSSLIADNPAAKMTDATVTAYDEDGYVGTRITFKDEPIASYTSLDSSITREGDSFVFTSTVPDATEVEKLPSDAMATLSVTFPGKVSKHNGTLEGTTVTWNLLTTTEAPYARGSAVTGGGGGTPVATYAIIGGALLFALIVGGVVLVNRRRTASAPGGDASTGTET